MATNKEKSSGLGAFSIRRSLADKSRILSKSEGTDPECKRLLKQVFRDDTRQQGNSEKELTLQTLPAHVDTLLDTATAAAASLSATEHQDYTSGRLGSDQVLFDIGGNSGTLVVEADRLGVASHSNFSTIHANVCVYKGKWVYELMLGSKGVMQLGWCTLSCRFSQEDGVGDTPDSYAYDGSRLRKWNVKTQKYGEAWLTGDVISCAMDLDNCTVTFSRNGHSLGEAFNMVRVGPGLAYFPAVSLSLGENLRANFGATPLRYPMEGYQPLQEPPKLDLIRAQQLFIYLENLLPPLIEQERGVMMASCRASGLTVTSSQVAEHRSRKATLLLIASHIFERLAPLLKNSYIVEACLFRFLLKFCDSKESLGEQPYVTRTLDLLWALMQEHELKPCLENLVVSLLSSYRFSPVSPDFSYQHMYLTLTLAILRHEDSRKHVLKHVLFDKVKFPIFLHVKPPDDGGLLELIPTVWWGFGHQADPEGEESKPKESSAEDDTCRQQYYLSCDELGRRVAALEVIQVEILKELLQTNDNEKGASTRFIFLHKFREFLKENSTTSVRGYLVNQCPLPVSLCFFHRLIKAVRFYWDKWEAEHVGQAPSSEEAHISCHHFYDDSINYFDGQRLGGLVSHLKKVYRDELILVRGLSPEERVTVLQSDVNSSNFGSSSGSSRPSSWLASLGDLHKKTHKGAAESSSEYPSGGVPSSLVEMLDGIVMLYNIAAHKQLGKMCSLRDIVNEYVNALDDTEKKIAECPSELPEVLEELKRAKSVFIEKTSEQARHMAWVIAVIYAKEKQEDVFWLLRTVLRTLQKASDEEKLFSFVPDFYVEVCINSYNALRAYFHPTAPYHSLPGFSDVLNQYALFLSRHFADARIVNADIRDNIVTALACFVCYPQSLRALEDTELSIRENVVKALLAPYENRSWAQTNWILVRLWKGCGFGFRYKHLPHLLPAKNQQQEIGCASLQKPCPSDVFQAHIQVLLHEDSEGAIKLIDTLLNQLNWAFSEFIGLLQELQQIALRPMASFVDSRQLKICATCFDISVGLLRVLEMIIHLSPELLTDWSRPSAELLLCRLFQLLSQVLNRVTSRSNMFEMVVSVGMPGLETVDHFPILTAVTGILVRLMVNPDSKVVECATAALLAEPGFQISSLEFLLGGTTDQAAATPPSDKKIFSLRKYKEVNEKEIMQAEKLLEHLRNQVDMARNQTQEIDEEALCNICYARSKSVMFKPCGHLSCRACISHQMMQKKECFFCKTPISDVVDLKGKTGK